MMAIETKKTQDKITTKAKKDNYLSNKIMEFLRTPFFFNNSTYKKQIGLIYIHIQNIKYH